MVKLGQPNECNHSTCPGAYPLKVDDSQLTADRHLYGGFWCLCRCHDANRAQDQVEKHKREMCPFCCSDPHDQSPCCKKLARLRYQLVVLRNYYGKHGLESRKLDIEKIIEETEK